MFWSTLDFFIWGILTPPKQQRPSTVSIPVSLQSLNHHSRTARCNWNWAISLFDEKRRPWRRQQQQRWCGNSINNMKKKTHRRHRFFLGVTKSTKNCFTDWQLTSFKIFYYWNVFVTPRSSLYLFQERNINVFLIMPLKRW